MTESKLRLAIDSVKAERAGYEKYSEGWCELGYEMARLTEKVRRVRADSVSSR